MREFAINASAQTVAGATSLIGVSAATAPNVNIEFLRYWVGQNANATSAQQRIEIVTQAATFPTFTGFTPNKLKPADPNASVITSSTMNTTWASGAQSGAGINASAENAGTKTAVWDDAFNVLNGWLHVPTPPETRVLPASFTSCQSLFFVSQPATLTGWAFGLVFREV